MPVKQASKGKKRLAKGAGPVLGAAGFTFALAGGASAVPTADLAQTPNFAPSEAFTLSEEELADVSLATFHLFDNESIAGGVLVAARGCGGCRGCGGARGCAVRGCGGCRGCGGFRGCRGCRGVGCRVGGCGGCGCGGCVSVGIGCVGCAVGWSCCASWGSCRWC
jgi:hypothetical protein